MCPHGLTSAATKVLHLGGPVELELGGQLESVHVAYRTWGHLDREGRNVVVVCHALTGSADVDRWWPQLLGPGRALDPETHFVVCANVLGSCYGSTGPAADGPGRHAWYGAFPAITIRDMVLTQRLLLDHLGVRGIRLVIGGSLGGMQALEWLLADTRVEAAVVVAAPALHSAWAIALSDAQRAAIRTDRRWRNGGYPWSDPPSSGLEAARRMAMCSYRSPRALDDRFGRREEHGSGFAVSSWLDHHGRSLAARFDAASYVTLTEAMDRHDVGRGRGGVATSLACIDVPVLVMGVSSDMLYPATEIQSLGSSIPGARVAYIDTPHGHDGFLIAADEVNRVVTDFRRRLRRPIAACAVG